MLIKSFVLFCYHSIMFFSFTTYLNSFDIQALGCFVSYPLFFYWYVSQVHGGPLIHDLTSTLFLQWEEVPFELELMGSYPLIFSCMFKTRLVCLNQGKCMFRSFHFHIFNLSSAIFSVSWVEIHLLDFSGCYNVFSGPFCYTKSDIKYTFRFLLKLAYKSIFKLSWSIWLRKVYIGCNNDFVFRFLISSSMRWVMRMPAAVVEEEGGVEGEVVDEAVEQ